MRERHTCYHDINPWWSPCGRMAKATNDIELVTCPSCIEYVADQVVRAIGPVCKRCGSPDCPAASGEQWHCDAGIRA